MAEPFPRKERDHGTYGCYQTGCRCFQCRLANAAQATEQRHRRLRRAPWQLGYAPRGRFWTVRHFFTGEVRFDSDDRDAAVTARDSLNRYYEAHCEDPPLWADEETLDAVRRHIERLRRRGIGLTRIADLSGVSVARVADIAAGATHGTRRPSRLRVRWENAQAILGVLPTAGEAGRVRAEETWRLIGELLAAGARPAEISRALGFDDRMGLPKFSRHRVLQKTLDRVREVHDDNLRVSPALRAVCRCARQSQRRAA